ncbi:MAG: ribbon-helix-helix domain-containing protein [Candidatus Bathyarchaeota archaeon]|nr:ribbon-helix-helix domain-containing protein [Candidatus Bathyarchaeota archaeon]
MSKTIGIRVDEELDQELETLAESMNLKKSQLIKQAFKEWHRTREGIQGQNMMQVDSVLIAAVFEHLSQDEIIAVADSLSSHVASLIRIRQIEENRQEEPIQKFLDNFTRLTSSRHFGWFTKLNYSTDDGIISIYGFHTLNKSYSRYAVELLHQVLQKLYKYKLINDEVTVTDNSFILKLKQ